MFANLKNRKGVTILEGMIAMLLLSIVTIGTFGVVLSSSRRVSQPDIREEMMLAVEQAHGFLQASSPTEIFDNIDYHGLLWDDGDGPAYQHAMKLVFNYNRPDFETDVPRLGVEPKWFALLTDGSSDLRDDNLLEHGETFAFNNIFLPALCNPAKSGLKVSRVENRSVPLLYTDVAMQDDDENMGIVNNQVQVLAVAFDIWCQGYSL